MLQLKTWLMNLILPGAEQYAELITTNASELLNEVETFTRENHAHAHMISGHLQGQLLRFISRLMQPRQILEIGTFTGYSTLCLAEGLAPGGLITTIELREEDASIARKFFNKSSFHEKIDLKVGNAKEIIPFLENMWDIVFIDADKVSYIDYYELILPKLKTNGLIIADNVLFHGQVLEEPITGKNAKAIHAFNLHVLNDNRVEQMLLTVRDGLMLIRKK